MTAHTKGLACGLVASALWGTTFVAGRYVVNTCGVDPLLVAALRFTVAVVLAFALLAAIGRGPALWAARREFPLLFALGTTGIGLMGICVFVSGRYTPAVNTSIIVNANTIFVALLGLLIGERLGLQGWLGLVVGLGGCGIVVLGQPPESTGASNHLLGALIAAAASLLWAVYTVAGKGVCRRVGGLIAGAWTLLTGAMVTVPAAALWGRLEMPPPGALLAMLFIAVFPTTVAMLLWYLGLQYTDAARIGPTQYLAPLSSAVLAWLLLGEAVGALVLIGGALVIVGMALCGTERQEAKQDAALLGRP